MNHIQEWRERPSRLKVSTMAHSPMRLVEQLESLLAKYLRIVVDALGGSLLFERRCADWRTIYFVDVV
jgi:hypothetical protein